MNRILSLLTFVILEVAAQTPPYSTYTYNEHVDLYHKFHSTPAIWYDAKVMCESEGAMLAIPRDEHEMEVLRTIFAAYPTASITGSTSADFLFIGFHDYFEELKFVAVNGLPIQYFYQNWMSGNPASSRSENCVNMYRDGGMNDASCSNLHAYICQKEGNTPKYYSDFGKCQTNDSAYVYFPTTGKEYKLHTQQRTWASARVICGLECGHLAIINNVHEEQFLTYLFNLPENRIGYLDNPDDAFIGYHDLFKEGEFITVTNQKVSSLGYIRWAQGNPDNLNSIEHCVVMESTGQLDDVDCSQLSLFFCERPVNNPYEYYPDVDLYYKFHREPLNWYEAKLKCSEEQASLALPRDQKEIDTIKMIFNRYRNITLTEVQFPNLVLLGFHDIFIENEFLSLKGESLQYFYHKWANGQPNNFGNEDCGSMHRSGGLNDMSCQIPSTFICQKPGREKKSPAVNLKCASNDIEYHHAEGTNKCYKVHMNPKRWLTARDACVIEGGQLAIVRSKAEEDFITKLILDPNNRVGYSNNPDHALIGFHDMFQEGRFTTVLDENLNSIGYINWGSAEPSNGALEDCGSIHISGTLNDISCVDPNIFVCEQPANLLEVRFQKGSISWILDYLKYIFGYL